MTTVFDVDSQMVWEVLGGHESFASPFDEFSGYSILLEEGTAAEEALVALYLDKLGEAVSQVHRLLREAFRPEYFDFYGVDREAAGSPEEMRRRLVFDSFVLSGKDAWVGACLSNKSFMFGHFIECWWNRDWKPFGSGIC